MSFDLILPFLRPIAHLIEDAAVTEIMVNGSGRIFVERDGHLEFAEGVTVREHNLRVAVRNLARVLGDDISEERPLLDSRLPDGSRVAAALPPVSLGGTTLTMTASRADRDPRATYVQRAASASNDTRELMPEQASATTKANRSDRRSRPSRATEIPSIPAPAAAPVAVTPCIANPTESSKPR